MCCERRRPTQDVRKAVATTKAGESLQPSVDVVPVFASVLIANNVELSWVSEMVNTTSAGSREEWGWKVVNAADAMEAAAN